MSVIINEFDIVLDKPEPPAEGAGQNQDAPAASQMKPKDVWAIVDRRFERMKRLRAH